jgi:hypothetical protein
MRTERDILGVVLDSQLDTRTGIELNVGMQKMIANLTSAGLFEPFLTGFGTPPTADPNDFAEFTIDTFRWFYLADAPASAKYLYQVRHLQLQQLQLQQLQLQQLQLQQLQLQQLQLQQLQLQQLQLRHLQSPQLPHLQSPIASLSVAVGPLDLLLDVPPGAATNGLLYVPRLFRNARTRRVRVGGHLLLLPRVRQEALHLQHHGVGEHLENRGQRRRPLQCVDQLLPGVVGGGGARVRWVPARHQRHRAPGEWRLAIGDWRLHLTSLLGHRSS